MRFLEHRIGDQRILRLIGKWLKAGVLEDDTWTEGTVGTPPASAGAGSRGGDLTAPGERLPALRL